MIGSKGNYINSKKANSLAASCLCLPKGYENTRTKIKLTEINKILVSAFVIRLAVLLLIALLGDVLPSFGFIDNSYAYDDFRYEEGAVLYSAEAKSLIDTEVFTKVYASMEDWVGYHLSNPFTGVYLWYWISCILIYITKWRWSLRILNIIFMTFAIKYVYRIAYYIYGEKTAVRAAKIMAYLPYMVIFSCFSYKECLAAFSTFFIWLYYVKKKYSGMNTKRETIQLVLCIFSLLFMRRGISIILIAFVLIYYFFEKIRERLNARNMLLFLLAIIVIVILFYKFYDIISFMVHAYMGSESIGTDVGGGALVRIRRIRDLWKLPLTFVFAILNPIGFSGKIDSWLSVVGCLNIAMCPIAVGALLDIFRKNKPDKIFFWLTLGYYFITIISSVLIFRQVFYLLPIPIICCADYFTNSRRENRVLALIFSMVLALMVILVFYL